MQCDITTILLFPVIAFVGFYGLLIIVAVLQVSNGQQARRTRIRAEEKQLGITPSWLTEYNRDHQSLEETIMGVYAIIRNLLTRTVIIVVGVMALIVTVVGSWQLCLAG